MAPRIEFLTGLLGAAVGLIGAAYIHGAAHSPSVAAAAAAFGVSSQLREIDWGVAAAAVVLVGLGLGAYVHSMFRLRPALILLWICAIVYVAMAFYAVAATRPVWSVIWLVVPSWLMADILVAGVLAIAACGSSILPWMLSRWQVADEASKNGSALSASGSP